MSGYLTIADRQSEGGGVPSSVSEEEVGDPGVPPKGTLDPEILSWCEAHQCVLVTNNRKSMRQHVSDHLAGQRHIPGIFELNPNLTVGETVEELLLIWDASGAEEYQDLILYLPLS